MTAVFGERCTLGQANGPEVEVRVFGDEHHARYETLDGYAAVYDEQRGLFCYARLEQGRFVSTGVPITEPAPPGLTPHLEESPEVRAARAAPRPRGRGPA